LIGMLQRGMSAGDAVKTYSILTIGDGLIAQIPALFISICAGMIVTRVTSADGGPSNVGKDIGGQLLAEPKAFMIGTVIMFGFGLIPGMPTATFLVLALVVGTLGYTLMKGKKKSIDVKTGRVTTGGSSSADGSSSDKPNDGSTMTPTVPLMLDVNSALESAFSAETLNEELVNIRRALHFDLGIIFPGIQLRFNDNLPTEVYSILVAEIPVSQGRLRPDYLLVRENVDNLSALSIPYETDKMFLPNIPTVWANSDLTNSLNLAGISYLKPTQVLSYHIAQVLKKYASEFIGIQETRIIITEMEAKFPELAKEVQRILPIHKIAEIIQRLVGEEVSIRNVRAVMEALIEWGQKEKDSVLLTEYVRVALKRYISHKYSTGQNILPAYLLSPTIEDTVRGAIRQTSGGSYIALDPNVSKKLVTNIKDTVGDLTAIRQRPVLLTSMDIRRYMKKMIEQDLPELAVLSYQELTQEINVQPLAKVEL
jgi:type III secretion protein V